MKRPGPLKLKYQDDLNGRRFAFFGKFEHWPAILGDKGPRGHVQSRGARLVKTLQSADYVVFGEGRGTGKKAALAQTEKLKARGRGPQQLDEKQFITDGVGAVKIESSSLNPGEATEIFIVS